MSDPSASAVSRAPEILGGAPDLLGPRALGGGAYRFTLWAPKAKTVYLECPDLGLRLPMNRLEQGYHEVAAHDLAPGTRYLFDLGRGKRRADPASSHQPDGVHGASSLVDHGAFAWSGAGFVPPAPEKRILYEMHVGTFTPEGTFDAAAAKIGHLRSLGVNCLELMPVAAFPGTRNWGYDGVYPYAVQESYGGPEGLKRLVDACHAHGMAVILDVVYNHLGPEGNYLRDFGPYFTKKFTTPWGEGLNFDGPGSDGVRAFFLQNALHWLSRYRIDGLRLDAVDHIWDQRPKHLLRELSENVETYGRADGREPFLIAESQANDPRMITPRAVGGHGLAGTWNDDFHHAVHALLTGERAGYYADYGGLSRVAETVRDGFSLAGRYSKYYGRRHGLPARHLPVDRFVNCLQNHDQIGNRAASDRLCASVPFERLKVAAALLFLSPGTPMLFMGEEFGETAPFTYFADHGDDWLITAVREGRKREFSAFRWRGEPRDPFAFATFAAARLDWSRLETERGRVCAAFYSRLAALRNGLAPFTSLDRDETLVQCHERRQVLVMERRGGGVRALCLFNFSARSARIDPARPGAWRTILDSRDAAFGGPGAGPAQDFGKPVLLAPHSACVHLTDGA